MVGGAVASAPPPSAMKAKKDAQEGNQAAQRDQAKAAPGLRIRAFSVITGTSDPRALRRELEVQILTPALAVALADLPAGTTLELKIDGTGKVVSASFDRSFPGAARAQELLETWRLRSWTGGLAGSLELILGWDR